MRDQGDIRKEYDPNKFFICAMANRPGVQLFCTKLEYKHYPPRTPKNDLFGLNIVQWQSLTFYVASVPLQDRWLCKEVAESIGMRLADGVPTLLQADGEKHFPLQGSNVWSLEGQFSGDERAEVEKIFTGDHGKMLDDFRIMTEIRHGTPKDVDKFMEEAVDYNAYSPIMAVLFGLGRRDYVEECFLGFIQDKAFACCTISRIRPSIIGLYVIPKARKLGIGTRLFKTAMQHCIDKNLTPVHVDVMSYAAMRIVEKLPPEMKQHCITNFKSEFDLNKLEEPYIVNKDWYMGMGR